MAGAKKRNAKRKRPMGRKKRSTKDIILRAIQYVSACLCVVFLAILIKNISDDMVSYEIQWENEQRLNALLSSPTATGWASLENSTAHRLSQGSRKLTPLSLAFCIISLA